MNIARNTDDDFVPDRVTVHASAWLSGCVALAATLLVACGGVGSVVTGPTEPSPVSFMHDAPDPDPIIVPAPPIRQQVLEVAIVSDLNGRYGSTEYNSSVHAAVANIVSDPPDLVITAGDMVAGQQEELDYDAMWDAFFRDVTDPITQKAGVPFAPTPGNHDASGYSRFVQERTVFSERWQTRRPDLDYVDDADFPLRYAYTMNDVLFISLDDTRTGPFPTAERQWLEGVLQNNTGHLATIVYGHLPLYPIAEGRQDEALNDPALERMLVQYDVGLFVSGHHHAYYPGRRGDLGLIGMGCLGGGARPLLGYEDDRGRSYARVVVYDDGSFGIDAYEGSRMDQLVDINSLPPVLGFAGSLIVRHDLDGVLIPEVQIAQGARTISR